ncbi:hypothetical protein [Streptomyces sp. NPDC090445]|uniref:hypothetical protein n=1 Tax=Streptomyces sp. NPDC090445 TaxID=3365963 RepID=UPI00381C084D
MSTGMISAAGTGSRTRQAGTGSKGRDRSVSSARRAEVLPPGGDEVAAVPVGALERDEPAPAPLFDAHDEIQVVGVVQLDVQPGAQEMARAPQER